MRRWPSGTRRRLPIRWKLAGTSAALTFAILCAFGLVVGELTERRIRDDFNNQLRAAADDLRDKVDVAFSNGRLLRFSPNLDVYGGAEHAVIRVLTPDGTVVRATKKAPNLGAPFARTNTRDGYRIETRPIPLQPGGTLFVQYARRASDMEATIKRVRVFLIVGVLGGSALALLAGLMIAARAMAPITRLTETAEEIRRTRDPGRHVPEPEADDEVTDLARTLNGMLSALDEAQTETEAALVRQREFVADASHELRTPLTSVLANLELLADTLDGEQGDAARSALRSSRRMRRLVADLLLLARADAGRAEAPRRPADLAQVIIEAASELEPVTGDHELTVDVHPVVIAGAPDELHRLALNLMENAVKHTPAGTHITAAVARDGDDAVLTVTDDGPGIAPDQRERIFDRFVRGGGDGGSGPASFGLGLSIVRAVTEAHHGTVTVTDGAFGHGTRFVVRLPAEPVTEVASVPAGSV